MMIEAAEWKRDADRTIGWELERVDVPKQLMRRADRAFLRVPNQAKHQRYMGLEAGLIRPDNAHSLSY